MPEDEKLLAGYNEALAAVYEVMIQPTAKPKPTPVPIPEAQHEAAFCLLRGWLNDRDPTVTRAFFKTFEEVIDNAVYEWIEAEPDEVRRLLLNELDDICEYCGAYKLVNPRCCDDRCADLDRESYRAKHPGTGFPTEE